MRSTRRVRDKLLKLLKQSPQGVLQSSLPSLLGVSKSRVSEVLSELEEEGLVVREKVGTTYLVKLAEPHHRRPRVLRLGFVWSSEYGFLVELVKGIESELEVKVSVEPYENSYKLAADLVQGAVDLGLLPLATVVLVSSSLAPLRVLGGGGSGGSFLVRLTTGREGVASTRASTMDLCRFAAVREGVAFGPTVYYDSPEKAVELALRGRVQYMALYQPLADMVAKRLAARLEVSCFELLDIPVCCTLASSQSLSSEFILKISRVYRAVLEHYDPRSPSGLEYYSRITGIPRSLLESTCSQYSYVASISRSELAKVVRVLSYSVPDPAWLEQVLLVEP